jgi:hypothetical protein
MIRKSFDKALKKGAVGEAIVRQLMEAKGWTVYQPFTEGAHAFDILGIKDKKTAIALDVKTKARLNKWPITGVSQSHFEEYWEFSEKHCMQFWIVFVDEMLREIYGNTIEELERSVLCEDGTIYPWVSEDPRGKKIRYWHLDSMRHIADIEVDDAETLRSLSQRSYEYKPTGS